LGPSLQTFPELTEKVSVAKTCRFVGRRNFTISGEATDYGSKEGVRQLFLALWPRSLQTSERRARWQVVHTQLKEALQRRVGHPFVRQNARHFWRHSSGGPGIKEQQA
jgi:hypothetical protein